MTEVERVAARLTDAQKRALAEIHRLGGNPYGWDALQFCSSGATAAALNERGLVYGGNIYGSRTRSYIITDRGRSVAAAILEAGGSHDG